MTGRSRRCRVPQRRPPRLSRWPTGHLCIRAAIGRHHRDSLDQLAPDQYEQACQRQVERQRRHCHIDDQTSDAVPQAEHRHVPDDGTPRSRKPRWEAPGLRDLAGTVPSYRCCAYGWDAAGPLCRVKAKSTCCSVKDQLLSGRFRSVPPCASALHRRLAASHGCASSSLVRLRHASLEVGACWPCRARPASKISQPRDRKTEERLR